MVLEKKRGGRRFAPLLLKEKSGFTLIEIIIVVVILGVLAAITVPKLTENIDKARAAEAFNIGSVFIKAVDRCMTDETGGTTNNMTDAHVDACNTFAEVSVFDSSAGSQNFDYVPSGSTLVSGITLTMTGKFSGATASDTISMHYDPMTGAVVNTCNAAGKFAKMCKN